MDWLSRHTSESPATESEAPDATAEPDEASPEPTGRRAFRHLSTGEVRVKPASSAAALAASPKWAEVDVPDDE